MVTKTFLVTGQELAEHSQKNQNLIFEMFTIAHQTYPDLTTEQLIQYTQDWALSLQETEEDFVYSNLHNLLPQAAVETENTENVDTVAEAEEALQEETLDDVLAEADAETVYADDYQEPQEIIEPVIEDDEETVYEPYEAEDYSTETVSDEYNDEENIENDDANETDEYAYNPEPENDNTVDTDSIALDTYEADLEQEEITLEEPTVEEEEEELILEETSEPEAEFFSAGEPTVISRRKRYKGLLSEAGKLDHL